MTRGEKEKLILTEIRDAIKHRSEVMEEMAYLNKKRDWWRPSAQDRRLTPESIWALENHMYHGPYDHRTGACVQCGLETNWCYCEGRYTIAYVEGAGEDSVGNRSKLPNGPWEVLERTKGIIKLDSWCPPRYHTCQNCSMQRKNCVCDMSR